MTRGSPTVLVLATTFPRWEDDEIPRFVHDLSTELVADELDVVVLAPHHPGAARKETMDGITVYRYPYVVPYSYQRLAYRGGILPSIKESKLALLQVPLLLLSLFVHAIWLVRAEDVDVVNSHWAVPNGLVGAFLRVAFGVPHVMTLHAGGVLGLGSVPFNDRIAKFLYNQSDRILPVSSHIRDSYTGLLPSGTAVHEDRFTVQPMGARLSDFGDVDRAAARERFDLSDDTVSVLYVGRLAEKKGVGHLLSAVEELRSLAPAFRLTVVGTGGLETELRETVVRKDLGDVVEFTGWIATEELQKRYVAADLVVVPSVETDSGDTEGMPTVIAESFAAGTPVVATGVGGIPDVVDDGVNGFIVEQRRPDLLADRIERLVTDDERRREMADRAHERAASLDWSVCGETYAMAIRDVAATPRRRRRREAP
jgi:glycosyltransferase involved in cell wall biosynthesis